MTRSEKERLFHSVAGRQDTELGSRILWSVHAANRLVKLPCSRRDIEQGLTSCEVIEDYPSGRRVLPDCLVLGFVRMDQPVHAVVALDVEHDRLLIVTVYSPDRERWTDDWRERR